MADTPLDTTGYDVKEISEKKDYINLKKKIEIKVLLIP